MDRRTSPQSSLIVVVSELRAVTTRSVALAGIAALAVYGSVAIGGARTDLIHGLDASFNQYLGTAQLWVTTGGNDLTTNAFVAGGAIEAIERSAGVASVRVYQGGYLDVGRRRLWIIARPSTDPVMIPESQILTGSQAHATRLLRQGGWAAISGAFAHEHRLVVGSAFTLPTPAGGARLRVAAITTNLGWSPGAIDPERGRLPPLLADRRAVCARGRARAGRERSDWQASGRASARQSPRPRRADAARTRAPVRR